MNCPDCNGTGKYVGLTVVENCSKCGGVGKELSGKFLPLNDTVPVLLDAGTNYISGQMAKDYLESLKKINRSEYLLFGNRQAEKRVHRIRTGGPAVISQVDGGIEVKEFSDVIRIDKISWSHGSIR